MSPTDYNITHLFTDDQVILAPGWLNRLVSVGRPICQFLRLMRPSTADLILTKMMRVDPQDRADILFLVGQLPEADSTMRNVLEKAVVPPIFEIEEAFEVNRSWLMGKL